MVRDGKECKSKGKEKPAPMSWKEVSISAKRSTLESSTISSPLLRLSVI